GRLAQAASERAFKAGMMPRHSTNCLAWLAGRQRRRTPSAVQRKARSRVDCRRSSQSWTSFLKIRRDVEWLKEHAWKAQHAFLRRRPGELQMKGVAGPRFEPARNTRSEIVGRGPAVVTPLNVVNCNSRCPLVGGGRKRWAHIDFTRINIELTIG